MRKLLVAGMISAAVATSAMAAPHTLGQAGDVLNLQAKSVDVKNLGSGTVYGVSYNLNVDLGQKDAWGMIWTLEYNQGSLDDDNDDDTTDYTEAGITFGISYVFNNNIKLYGGAKFGSVKLDGNSDDSDSGELVSGVFGAQYSINHFVIGLQAESGTISYPAVDFDTTSYTATLGYKF